MFKLCKLNDYNDILSQKDVQSILGIGRNKSYQLLKSGAIKNFKIGREIKIPKHCLEEYINSMLSENDYCDT